MRRPDITVRMMPVIRTDIGATLRVAPNITARRVPVMHT
jgi:hypothetical protein